MEERAREDARLRRTRTFASPNATNASSAPGRRKDVLCVIAAIALAGMLALSVSAVVDVYHTYREARAAAADGAYISSACRRCWNQSSSIPASQTRRLLRRRSANWPPPSMTLRWSGVILERERSQPRATPASHEGRWPPSRRWLRRLTKHVLRDSI